MFRKQGKQVYLTQKKFFLDNMTALALQTIITVSRRRSLIFDLVLTSVKTVGLENLFQNNLKQMTEFSP